MFSLPDYNVLALEKKWQERWLADGTYTFNINAPGDVYAIDNPPSFTSGSLHMGHALNHSWIDFIARYKRMRGYNVLFPLGYDCHGLPTELRVMKEYKISPADRKLFREKCEEFTTKMIAKMNEQYKRLGYSCDWDEYYETRSPKYKALVQKSLLDFHKMGRVYREEYPVLWCTKCRTALAKAEVGHIEEHGHLWHISLAVEGMKEKITFATTRPELMPACIAVMVHPKDSRYTRFIGKQAILPYFNRKVPIIAEDWVDMAFGTGVVYHCTFGDEDDVKWQRKYNLPIHRALDEAGRMTEIAGKYKGMKVREAQAAIVEDLKRDGHLVKDEPFTHNVLAHTERSSCMNPVEFLSKHQFFIRMKDKLGDIVDAANGMRWFPENIKIRLTDWAENMDWDWIISRQRIYGTPIPFWHCEKCGKLYPPAESKLPIDTMVDPAPAAECACGGPLKGTSDTCDVWMDSSVSPLAVTKWAWDSKYFEKAYPCGLRPQGYEIIRTWAFYTIFRCLLLTGEKPFKDVVINGMVAGADGRKMSKSYGNIVAPDVILDKEGADALRQWALCATLAEDYPYSSKEIVHGLKFQKKLWNAAFFSSQFLGAKPPAKPHKLRPADKWILHRLNKLIRDATESLDSYEFAKALVPIRDFFWHDFCDNYLEIAKDRLYNGSAEDKAAAQYALHECLTKSTLLLAPFIPHIAEEIHELYLKKYTAAKSVHLMAWPKADARIIDPALDELGDDMTAVIAAVRKFKSESQLALNTEIAKVVVHKASLAPLADDIREAVKAKAMEFNDGTGPVAVKGFSVTVMK